MITYDQLCKQIEIEIKSLSKEELKTKITAWTLNKELKIYVPVLQKELNKR